MKAGYFPILKMVIITALIFGVAGCGSGSSTAINGTGAITAKLVWTGSNTSPAKDAAKVLHAAPAGVVKMRFTVSAADMADITKEFAAIPGSDGSGVIDGIPAGTGRKVTAQGLDSGGTVLFQGATLSNIAITVGVVTPVGTITMADAQPPVTTASPAGGTYGSAQNVTLSANEPATIYYTTNGNDPTTGSPNGLHTGVTITISAPATLKFFAVDTAGNSETVKTEIYTITIGSLVVTW